MLKHLAKLFRSPWYFITLAAYPPLALLSYNIPQVRFDAVLRPLAISIASAGVLLLLFRLVYHNWHRAAFSTALLTILIYTYGHATDAISKKWQIVNLTYWMAGIWLILSALVLILAGNRKIKFENAAIGINVVSLGLVVVALGQVVWWQTPQQAGTVPVDDHAPLREINLPNGQVPPDIYYIIPDSYGRSDLLLQAFGLDNSAFIQRLQEMGFYVAECSQSNYNRTDVSLASSLNHGIPPKSG